MPSIEQDVAKSAKFLTPEQVRQIDEAVTYRNTVERVGVEVDRHIVISTMLDLGIKEYRRIVGLDAAKSETVAA